MFRTTSLTESVADDPVAQYALVPGMCALRAALGRAVEPVTVVCRAIAVERLEGQVLDSDFSEAACPGDASHARLLHACVREYLVYETVTRLILL